MRQAKSDKNNTGPVSRPPEIIVDFECEDDSLFMVIANVGLSSAHRISIQCDKEIRDFRGRQITEMPILRRLEFMPPGKKVRLFVDRFSAYVKAKQPMQLEFSITYFDRERRQQTDTIRHNLAIYRGIITSNGKNGKARTGTPVSLTAPDRIFEYEY